MSNQKLSGDELLLYGFKRLIEELQKTQGLLNGLIEKEEKNRIYLRSIEEHTKNAEGYLFTLNDTQLQTQSVLNKIEGNTFLTQTAVMRQNEALRKDSPDE